MSDTVAQILADELTSFVNGLPTFFSSLVYPIGYLAIAYISWGFFSWLLSLLKELVTKPFRTVRFR